MHVIGVVSSQLVWNQLTVVANGIGRGARAGVPSIAGSDLLDAGDGGSLHGEGSHSSDDTCAMVQLIGLKDFKGTSKGKHGCYHQI